METQNEYMVRPADYMETLICNVEHWAREKGIADYENWEKQFMKFQEEAFELYKEMALHDARLKDKNIDIYIYDKEDMKLEMGDVLVTLIVLAKQQDIELSECLSMVWNKISKRKGKTVDGNFYKQADLEGMEWEK